MAPREATSYKFMVLIAFFLILSRNQVKGKQSKSQEEDEDLELDRQLKILNKPAIKTIKTEYGDIYDCIDINKQPALDHPLLKNHKIQMKPSSFLKKKREKISLHNGGSSIALSSKIGLNEGCPPRTVPIRRTRKEDLIRAKSLSKMHATNIHRLDYSRFGYSAGLRTKSDDSKVYHGAGAWIGLYNPTVSLDQFSGALITVQNWTSDQVNYIQAGWTNDDRVTTGCFDNHCPGFISVNPNIPLGIVIDPVSVVEGPQKNLRFVVSQDLAGNWWLMIGENQTKIGYWPRNIFTTLNVSANHVKWGGLVYGPEGGASPPMGSGLYPTEGYYRACFFREIRVVNASYSLVDPHDSFMEKDDESPCYHVGSQGYKEAPLWYSFLFGGPGGKMFGGPGGHCRG